VAATWAGQVLATAWGSQAQLAMGLTVLVAACLQGVSGIGFAMLSAPLSALFFPQLVPGPLLALSFPLALLAALREARQIDWRAAGQALAGRVAGALLAVALLVQVSAQAMAVAFALLLLAAVGLSLAGWQVRPTGRNVAWAGVASGLMGTITSAGAPPFALVMHSLPAARLRATLGCVFCAGTAVSLALLAAAGRFGGTQLALSAALLPWALVGFAASGPLARHLPQTLLRHLLLALAGAGGLAVLWRALS
jgi:uncharacterized membrane protein YfcA